MRSISQSHLDWGLDFDLVMPSVVNSLKPHECYLSSMLMVSSLIIETVFP